MKWLLYKVMGRGPVVFANTGISVQAILTLHFTSGLNF